MRLIDADAIYSRLKPYSPEDEKCAVTLGTALRLIYNAVDNAPTVDAVEVVHGHWIWVKDHWECSICRGNRFTHDIMLGLDAAYCSRCGAKMDVVSE